MDSDTKRVAVDASAPAPTLRRLRDTEQTISSSDTDIRGRMVRDKDGKEVGKVEGLMIDDAEQKVRFMEVASGGFLGIGERKSYIPVDAITRISEADVSIDHTRDHVASAPPYDPDIVKSNPDYFFALYPYYGYPGYLGFVPPIGSYPYAQSRTPAPEKSDR